MNGEEAFNAIRKEREYQDRKWGTPQDNPHEISGWLFIMRRELDEAKQAWVKGMDADAIEEIVQVAAVAVACLEQHGVPIHALAERWREDREHEHHP